MNKKEVAALFGLISALFPRDEKFAQADKMMITAWAEMLADIPLEKAKEAVKYAVATSPFPPSISEIRNYAVKISENSLHSPEEAWKIAIDAVRTYNTRTVPIEGFSHTEEVRKKGEHYSGGYNVAQVRPSGVEYEAKRNVPPDVWEVMELMGYADMCASENMDVLRGQFMKIWNNKADREHEYRVVAPVVPQIVERVAKNLLLGGENGDIE